jgi:hypothetical protein
MAFLPTNPADAIRLQLEGFRIEFYPSDKSLIIYVAPDYNVTFQAGRTIREGADTGTLYHRIILSMYLLGSGGKIEVKETAPVSVEEKPSPSRPTDTSLGEITEG